MHMRAYAALGLQATYVPFCVKPEALDAALAGLKALGVSGVNVTLPHKENVIALLDEVDDSARAIGAVNTITFDNGRSYGRNTDAPGFIRSLSESGYRISGTHVVVLGAGGAARAVVRGLQAHGARAIHVVARRLTQAQTLVTEMAEFTASASVLTAHAWAELEDVFVGTDLLVQATSATLEGNPQGLSLVQSLPWPSLPKQAWVVDLVYRPRMTVLLEEAVRRGYQVHDGLGMLLYQGALAFEHWLGCAAPVEVMRQCLEEMQPSALIRND